MRIDPGASGAPLPGRKSARPVSPSASAKGVSRHSSTTSETSPEASRLTSQLRDIPEIRPEVMAEVRERLKRGELLTRDAAEATAAAILADLASFIGP